MNIAAALGKLHSEFDPHIIAGNFNARHVTWSPPSAATKDYGCLRPR